MITCEDILKKPQVVDSLIGMSPAEFERLYAKFELVHMAHVGALQHTRRNQVKRRRAVGAGPKHKYALCDRLLMTLFWLRAYTTYKVLGTLYGLDKTTIEENLKSVLQTLSLVDCFNLERPQADVPKLRSVEEVVNTFPEVLLFLDSQEGSVKRPQTKANGLSAL